MWLPMLAVFTPWMRIKYVFSRNFEMEEASLRTRMYGLWQEVWENDHEAICSWLGKTVRFDR